MSMTTEKTVRELALENPAATRVFEKLGIDYCCGGGKPLGEACQAAGLPLETVIEALATAVPRATETTDWQKSTLTSLIQHIIHTHHQFVTAETERLRPLFAKVCSKHGVNHPELEQMRTIFGGLADELAMHLMKEERILFPYIVRMEETVLRNLPAPPPPFGSVRNPIAMMISEHDGAGEALRELRAASNGYTAPADGCVSYQTLYKALAEFETDLHQHIHLENNVLFPRAVEMERAAAR
jgi:regulator of cell morphogenesis and NO signaling